MASRNLLQAEQRFTEAITAALRRIPFSGLNEPLYHFTDAKGLEGILETKSLWASLAMALDGAAEINYALARASQLLRHREVTCDPSFSDEIIPLLDPMESKTISILGMKTYVVSFRTNIDSSGHWESYGRSGTGFALGFALKPLVIPGVLPIPVLYDLAAQDRVLREFIESSGKLLSDLSQDCPAEESWASRQRAVQWTALGLWTLAPTMKDPSFQVENEWRLIVVDLDHVAIRYATGLSKEVRVRRSKNREIPYKVLEYESLPIVHLELGPNAPVAENDPSIRQRLLRATSGFDVPITRSIVLVGPENG
jgi:hypothetical protein